MARKGYDGTSMRNLAQETGRSLGGLYHYFKNKEELIYVINQRGFSSLLELARTIEQHDLNPEEKLYAFISNHLRYFAAHLDEMRVMMFGTRHLNAKQEKLISQLKNDYGVLGEKIVGSYLKAHSSRKPTKQEVTRETFFLFGMMNWIFSWYSVDEHGGQDVLIDEIFMTFTKGASHKKSKELRIKVNKKESAQEASHGRH